VLKWSCGPVVECDGEVEVKVEVEQERARAEVRGQGAEVRMAEGARRGEWSFG
jgi:hypothetical protein